jgi:hypothetical protein
VSVIASAGLTHSVCTVLSEPKSRKVLGETPYLEATFGWLFSF